MVSICNPSCCLLAIVFISFAKCGSQTVAEYSRIGRTKSLYAVSLVSDEAECIVRFIGDMSMWGPQFRLSSVCLCQGILLCLHFAGCVRVGGMMVQISFSFGWHSTCSIYVDGSSCTTVSPMWPGNQDLFAAFSGPLCV